jgi:hypothetical protein
MSFIYLFELVGLDSLDDLIWLQIVRYDAEALGALRFESLSAFVVEAHRL